MDFYKYINSKDVAKHLKEGHFSLNSLQCLWIIFQNDKITLNEKKEALEYILYMPDCEFESSECSFGISVHKVIDEYFNYINTIKDELKNKDENCFYECFIKYEDRTVHPSIYFSDYKTCYSHIENYFLDKECIVLGYEIHKIHLNKYEDRIKAEYTGGILTSIHKCGDWDPLIKLLGRDWELIKLTSPFKPGDILYDLIEERPVVLESASHEDMSAICYYVSDDGKTLEKDYVLFYTNLEYNNKELTWKDIILNVVSDFIKRQQWFRL